jgi:transcriptional regulator with PAS, ATPase and Fis domain
MSRVSEKQPPVGTSDSDPSTDVPIRRMKKSTSRQELLNLVEFLGLVLDNVYSGIIVCDLNCRIIFMNQVYADLLKADRKQAVGKHIKEYFPHSRLPEVLTSGTPQLGQKCSLKTDAVLLVNRIPLQSEGKTVGIIMQTIFRDYKDFTDLVAKLNFLEREVKFQKRALESVLSARHTFDSIIGESKAINDAKALAGKFAQTDSPVLILGETGTGKELFAHSIHAASQRSSGPFVCLNCAAVPKDLLESELFGYVFGAFTGARKEGKPGQIELANGGTLYLDEIAELPLNAQATLLRVVENKVLRKLGAVKSNEVDFRLVASTNRDLREMMGRGEFREDFYYRLSTMILRIPPLIQRFGDIRILVPHLLRTAGKHHLRVTEKAFAVLERYDWPGNVRELKNVIDSALSVADEGVLDVEQLPPEVLGPSRCNRELSDFSDSCLAEEMACFEKTILVRAVRRAEGNMSRAAKQLGISRSTLYEKCRKHDLVSALGKLQAR